jgi:hypothetical protein
LARRKSSGTRTGHPHSLLMQPWPPPQKSHQFRAGARSANPSQRCFSECTLASTPRVASRVKQGTLSKKHTFISSLPRTDTCWCSTSKKRGKARNVRLSSLCAYFTESLFFEALHVFHCHHDPRLWQKNR